MQTKNNVVYSQKSDDCHRVVVKSGSSYKMVWWNESCSGKLFLTAQPQHICNDLDQCFVNILSLTSSDLPKVQSLSNKTLMMNTICRQHVRQLYSNKMLSLQSMQKLWRCSLLRIRRPGTSFLLQALWIDLIRKKDRCIRNLLQMLSVTKYCKSGCCPINSITRADAEKSTNDAYTTRLCPDALDNFLDDYIDRKLCTSICQWDTVCTRTRSSGNPNYHTPNIATTSCPWHGSSNTATVLRSKYPQHRHLGKHRQ